MKEHQCHDNFPLWIVILSNLTGLSIYGIGAYILSGFGVLWIIPYLLYCFAIDITVLRNSCVNCYYYGKVCGLGKGKVCAMLFKQGEPAKFAEKELYWYHMMPDFLAFIFPIIGGIVRLITDFSWITVILLAILTLIAFAGNSFIRGSLVCKYCRQRELGCPADRLFNREK